MKNHSDNFSLFRLSDRKQFDNVGLDTIDFFFRALSEGGRVDWLMWREGFSGWRPLGELSQIFKHLENESELVSAPPPVPDAVLKYAEEVTGVKAYNPDLTSNTVSSRAIDAVTSTVRLKTVSRNLPIKLDPSLNGKVLSMGDEETLSLMLESQAATEDRNNARYTKNFKVKIFAPSGVVVLETVDCSTSGFRLSEPLPKGLARFFHVEIDLGSEGKIPLVCSEVREKGGAGATRVRIQINDHFNLLKSALLRAA